MNITIKIKLIPLIATGAAAAFLWYTRPSQASFTPWFSEWVRRRLADEDKASGASSNKVTKWINSMANSVASATASVVSETKHMNLYVARLALVQFPWEEKRLFLGLLGFWIDLTPPRQAEAK